MEKSPAWEYGVVLQLGKSIIAQFGCLDVVKRTFCLRDCRVQIERLFFETREKPDNHPPKLVHICS